MTAATKKVMLFVVEGPSDETAFALLFDRVFSEHLVKFDVTHCDMTTARSFAQAGRHESEPNAYERLRGQIIEHIKRSPYEWSDLQQIVQIVDTDGAFVPDDCVVQSEGGALVYGYDKIEAPDRDQICRRNKRKKEALSKLCGKRLFTYEKKNVPYAVYYLPRNMEHVLHNRADEVSDREKELLSRAFRRRYQNDLAGFQDFLRTSDFSEEGDCAETWRSIRQGTRSLERRSNLHLVLPE